MTTETWLTQGGGRVAKDDMNRFMLQSLMKSGAPMDHAAQLADVLITADYRGIFSQGLNRLEMHMKQIHSGQVDAYAHPAVLKEMEAVAWVDGRNALGPIVGNFCMQFAIDKAKVAGMGWVTAKESNDFGFAAYYSMQALEEGMIGWAMSNTAPRITPPQARKPFVGSNPFSFAAPALYKDAFVLDMACSTASMGKVDLKRRQQERLPPGWALTDHGGATTDPLEAVRARSLPPLGAAPPADSVWARVRTASDSRGYKGLGLAIAVETLTSVLGGGPCGPELMDWRHRPDLPPNLSQTYIAIDPKRFAPDYDKRLYDMMYRMRGMDPVDRSKKILVAGDPERAHMKEVDRNGGIMYHTNLLKHALALANFLDVEPVKIM